MTKSWLTRDNAEAIPFLVAVLARGEGIQVDLTIPKADLKEVDALAEKQGRSRSAVLTEAARRMIACRSHPKKDVPIGTIKSIERQSGLKIR